MSPLRNRALSLGVLLAVVSSLALAACAAPSPTPLATSAPVAQQAAAQPAAAPTSAPAAQPAAPTTAPAAKPAATSAPAASQGKDVMVVSKEQQSSWVRNFNPLLPDQSQRWPTRAGIYEPLLVYNVMTGKYVPWLASDYKWSDGNKKLTMTTRDNVKWSDGQPFTAKDVEFTFQLKKKFKELDDLSVWAYLSDVKAVDAKTVEFTMPQAYVPGLYNISQQPIVPEHVWKDVADPVKFTNENPVATGPFTEVRVFQNQVYELGRNPKYWQSGKPYIDALRFPAFTSNDQANLAIINGEVDWSGNFLPDVEKTYVAKSPDNKYWFPPVGGDVMLYLNTMKPPFDNPDVRKAISMAINREQIVKVAMFDYVKPADATGLSEAYAAWMDPEAIKAGTWVKMDVEKANQMLDAAGLKKGSDGIRIGPDGKPMRYDLNVVTGWTDWVSSCQIMSQNLKAIGIDAPVKPSEFAAWFDMVKKGQFDISIGWSTNLPFPYNYFREKMGTETVRPIGTEAGENWQRYGNKEADTLLTKLAASADESEQKQIVSQLQKIFVDNAPAIPLFPGPSWGTYNTKRFTGWPNADNPWAKLTPNDPPGFILVLTEVKPK